MRDEEKEKERRKRRKRKRRRRGGGYPCPHSLNYFFFIVSGAGSRPGQQLCTAYISNSCLLLG